MKKSKFSEAQRAQIVSEQASSNVEAICEKYQISAATFYKWKTELSDAQNEDKKRLRELEKENARLKKLYADSQLEKDVLSEALRIAKKLSARRNKTN